jgi:NAD(P)H-hydrate epimerase
MVFFASPEPSVGKVAEHLKSKLSSFIWVPWNEVDEYLGKSDAILIGPGLMRYHKKVKNSKLKIKNLDKAGLETKKITEDLLKRFPQKQWVIDAGSLQVMEPKFIPKNAILTPNKKEFEMLFGGSLMVLKSPARNFDSASDSLAPRLRSGQASKKVYPEFIEGQCEASQNLAGSSHQFQALASKYSCIIVLKDVQTIVCSPKECVLVNGGNAGLTKGGTGDVLAGLTVALAAKNPPFPAACAASFVVKKVAEQLYQKVGFAYNADDLAEKIPEVLGKSWR